MKRICSVFLSIIIVFPLFVLRAEGLGSYDLSAECAVVMCVQTGEVLFEKNSRRRHSMASTTKIMTSLLALEQHTPSRVIKADKESITVEGTSMGLQEGDTVTLGGLVHGMLLLSGNDSANLTAKTIGGSNADFAVLMNKRAKEIGMSGTHFVTPSGLDDDEHYTTAYDMALLGCEAVKNPEFLNICSEKKAVVLCGNPPAEHTFYNHNKLLSYYDGCLGIKTGFTKKSGRCLVSCAEKNGVMLVAVTLNAPSDWSDHRLLLDYGFEKVNASVQNTEKISIAVTGGEKSTASVFCGEVTVCAENAQKKIFTEKFLYAPVRIGDVAGEVRWYSGGRLIASAPLTVCENITAVKTDKKAEKKGTIAKIKDLFRRK